MVDNDNKAGHQAVERARKAAQTNDLGPGTSGFTTSGAAYQGKNVADAIGASGPAEQGFGTNNGLGYVDPDVTAPSGYAPTEKGPGKPEGGFLHGSKSDVTPDQPKGTAT
ncbi:MAG TPA: hypothetical protein VGK74_29170 [Symbiobacteriaceae bacterium]|jgi:hypothetical protein